MTDFNQKEAIKTIELYLDENHTKVEPKDKIFYSWNELWGWRFFRKAIKHRDWNSIIKHIFR